MARALEWHSRGRRFNSVHLHERNGHPQGWPFLFTAKTEVDGIERSAARREAAEARQDAERQRRPRPGARRQDAAERRPIPSTSTKETVTGNGGRFCFPGETEADGIEGSARLGATEGPSPLKAAIRGGRMIVSPALEAHPGKDGAGRRAPGPSGASPCPTRSILR